MSSDQLPEEMYPRMRAMRGGAVEAIEDKDPNATAKLLEEAFKKGKVKDIGEFKGTRAYRRERKVIEDFLLGLTRQFINFVSNQEDKEGDHVAAKFVELDAQWKRFCKRKWLYNQTNLDGFRENVEFNIKKIATPPVIPTADAAAE